MAIHIQFKKIHSTEALKEHIEKRVEKFEKFVTYPMEIHVFLSVDREIHSAEIKCHAEHRDIVATAEAEDLYASIDMVCHKIENQLKKEREKKKGHTAAHTSIRKSKEELSTDLAAEIPHLGKRDRVE